MRYKLMVKSNASSPEQEEVYNQWYSTEHLTQVLELPGVVAAERLVFADTQLKGTPEPTHKYLAIYTIETDDIMILITAMRERLGTPRMVISETIDVAHVWTELYQELVSRFPNPPD